MTELTRVGLSLIIGGIDNSLDQDDLANILMLSFRNCTKLEVVLYKDVKTSLSP